MLCAPNRQNVQGCIEMVQSFRDPGLKEARDGRDLHFLILPARVDDQDSTGYLKFRDELFVPMVAPPSEMREPPKSSGMNTSPNPND